MGKLIEGVNSLDEQDSALSKSFDFFDMYVLDSKYAKNKTSREKVALFIAIFFGEDFSESQSGRGNALTDKIIVNGIEIKVNPDYYNKFKLLYSLRDYSKLEQKQITAITDRLIEDTDRRRKGDFYTPTIWVDEAHKLLDKNLGNNWRDEYIVWDCAWGTGNLTRDYDFKDLYCSTLNQEELNIGTRYNRNATKFQYDFLNDDVEEFEQARAALRKPFRFKQGVNTEAMEQFINFKDILDLYTKAVENNVITLEEGQQAYSEAVGILKNTKLYSVAPSLVNSLIDGGEEGKKLLFFINPPYKKTGAITSGKSSLNINNDKSKLNEVYNANTTQLYSQFIYRITVIKRIFKQDIYLGIFCPAAIYSIDEHRDLLKYAYDNGMKFQEGFIFKSGYFDGTGSDWPVAFSILGGERSRDENEVKIMQSPLEYKFNLSIADIVDDSIMQGKSKVIYTLDKDLQCARWVKRNIKKGRDPVPYISNALGTEDRKVKYTKGYSDNIGGFWCHSNRVTDNNSRVSLWSAIPNQASGNPISEDTFEDMISLFSARKLISGNYNTWLNDTDQYMIPDTNNENYNQWVIDSIIYSLFNTSSFQTSLRNVVCQGKLWDIQNEFFWLSPKELEKLAGGIYNKEDINLSIEDDLEKFGKERYVYQKLQEVTLSPDAQAVLDKATDILKKTFKYRKQFNLIHPEYHINTWDAGWYQIKALAKEYLPEELKQFNDLYKALGDRMRSLVYTLGFLHP